MKINVLLWVFTLMGLGLAAGCSEDGGGTEPVCAPGERQVCPCAGGLEGIQECREDRSGWKACEGCGEVVVGQDTSSAGDLPLGECDYTNCEGDICVDENDCCENAACNSWVFYNTDSFAENYCYPICAPETEEEQCKCGDVCVEVDTLPMCLKTGYFQLDTVSSEVGVVSDSIYYWMEDLGLNFSVGHGDDRITLELIEFWFDEENDLIILVQGMAGVSSAWVLQIIIFEETFAQGVGQYDAVAADGSLNFDADLFFGNLDDEYRFEEMWLESIPDLEFSSMTIDQVCEPCEPDAADCDQCEFSFDLAWFGLRAKLN